ncbi:MAG: radical SAM protein [Clostridia bacterium]|nr:radical SAM protein [Clostridia bacterium]
MIDCQHFGDDFLNEISIWAKQNRIPLYTTFELTPFCNFSCVMCYVRLDKNLAKEQGEMLTADQWIEIARQAKEAGTLHLTLTGGEPLSHPDFWKIYKELNKMGFLINILSNGSLIDEEAMANFRRYGMPHMMKLTVYGASDETYKRVCNSSDGFTKLSKAVDLLKEARVPLKMTSTIVKENACDLQKIYAFAHEKGISMQHTISVHKSSRGSINTVESSRFEFADFPDEISLDMLERSKFPPLETPFAWCASLGQSLVITWHGHFQLCTSLSDPYVQYSGDFLKDFHSLDKLLRSVKSPIECHSCEWKEFCQRCPGILCAESGHPEKIDSSFCLMAKRLQDLYNIKKEEM